MAAEYLVLKYFALLSAREQWWNLDVWGKAASFLANGVTESSSQK